GADRCTAGPAARIGSRADGRDGSRRAADRSGDCDPRRQARRAGGATAVLVAHHRVSRGAGAKRWRAGWKTTRVLVAGDAARGEYDRQQSQRCGDAAGRGDDQGGAGTDSRAGGKPRMNPFPLILSSPSGGGKTTIARMLLERRRDVGYSVSCTTRTARPG